MKKGWIRWRVRKRLLFCNVVWESQSHTLEDWGPQAAGGARCFQLCAVDLAHEFIFLECIAHQLETEKGLNCDLSGYGAAPAYEQSSWSPHFRTCQRKGFHGLGLYKTGLSIRRTGAKQSKNFRTPQHFAIWSNRPLRNRKALWGRPSQARPAANLWLRRRQRPAANLGAHRRHRGPWNLKALWGRWAPWSKPSTPGRPALPGMVRWLLSTLSIQGTHHRCNWTGVLEIPSTTKGL